MPGMPAAREVSILSPNSLQTKRFEMYTLFGCFRNSTCMGGWVLYVGWKKSVLSFLEGGMLNECSSSIRYFAIGGRIGNTLDLASADWRQKAVSTRARVPNRSSSLRCAASSKAASHAENTLKRSNLLFTPPNHPYR